MRIVQDALVACLALPVICFLIVTVPAVNGEVESRSGLLPFYYLSRQMEMEAKAAESLGEIVPPSYGRIIDEYTPVTSHPEFQQLKRESHTSRRLSYPERMVAKVILWRRDLPADYLEADPITEISDRLARLVAEERKLEMERYRIVLSEALDCLAFHAPVFSEPPGLRNGLPPEAFAKGLVFCNERIPIDRRDVRRRIEYQIDYLLNDFRDTTELWLKRRDRYRKIVQGILRKGGAPLEMALLPALESGYSSRALSQRKARGWWQFAKTTATQALTEDPALDWTLRVDRRLDERCDLELSTVAAARYLKWLQTRLAGSVDNPSWLIVAAAYNAGLNEVQYRMGAYHTGSYWDLKLPLETEEYVPRWIALSLIDRNRVYYNIEVDRAPPLLYESIPGVTLTRDLPLGFLAAMTESSVRFIREINGAVPRDLDCFTATLNGKTVAHTIHVPTGWKKNVVRALERGAFVSAISRQRKDRRRPRTAKDIR